MSNKCWKVKGYDEGDRSTFHVYEAPDGKTALDRLASLYKDGYAHVEIYDPSGALRDWDEVRNTFRNK